MNMHSEIISWDPAYDEDRRNEHRRRVLKTGTIHFNNGYGSYGCQVRNLCDGGALLKFVETSDIPSIFELRMTPDTRTTAEVVWRGKDTIGVRFNA